MGIAVRRQCGNGARHARAARPAGTRPVRPPAGTGTILTRAARLRDFSKPVAVTMLAILHAIPDSDDPYAIVARLTDAVPSGSYLAISHLASDILDQETQQGLVDSLKGNVQQQFTGRSREQVARFFAGLDLVEPGIVQEWRPEPGARNEGNTPGWCAVGRKR